MPSVMSEKMCGTFSLNCDQANVIGCDASLMEHLS